MRRFWIALVILGLARLPLPIFDLPNPTLVVQDSSSPAAIDGETSEPPGNTWRLRWVTLSPGSCCPIAGPSDLASTENDLDADCDAFESEVEFLPNGRARRIANPFADRAFDAIPVTPTGDPTENPVAAAARSFVASFSPDIPRPALLQRWIC